LKSARRVTFFIFVAFPVTLFRPDHALAQIGGGGAGMNGPSDWMSGEIIVPTGNRNDGKNGAFFQTDVRMRCQIVPTRATFHFHAADSASANPMATANVNLT
jgi:hypothetical protein